MTSEQFQYLRSTFEHLVAASLEEQAACVRQLSSENPELARELQRMLEAYSRSSSVLDRPVALPAAADVPVVSRIGSLVGSYRLEKELGHGGMGVVYRATRADGSYEKRVAIKILRHDRIDDLFLNRFRQERHILGQLSHPHIVAMLDAGVTAEGDPYFVMDYVEGVSLTAYCAAHTLTVRQKLELFLQICDAVQYAHRNLTVHRDLKPGNILVTDAGAVKLLDFGIAKLMQPDEEGSSDISLTAAILTPDYASPEQIRREPISTAADIFSLGILLYEMISGEHPFRGKGRLPHQVMRAICEDDPPAPSAVAHRDGRLLRGELDAITLTALRKQPSWRYPSVEQLADDVGRYLRGWPVLARGNSLPYRFRKFARRQWLSLAAAAVLVLLLAGGLLITRREARVAEQARDTAEQSRLRAERERIEADQQRNLAEQARHFAAGQQALAEARLKEAEAERQKERERYREVRALSSSLLFDLYDGVRDLAGSATARRLIVAKAQQQLELLSRDSGKDIGLQRDLAASYERMGELRMDPRHPNKNDAGAAVDAYRRAVTLRKEIAARPDATAADRRDLALSLAKLGDGQFLAGNSPLAVASDQSAWSLVEAAAQANPDDALTSRALGAVDERRCIILLASGNSSGALEACDEGIRTLSPLAKGMPDDVEVQRLVASTEGSYANALRLSGKPKEAASHARLAVEFLQRLQALAPSNAEYRRLASSAETILAGSLAAGGDIPAGLEAFRQSVRSMEIAVEIDPSDLGSPLRLAVSLLAFSRRLAQGTQKEEAHDTAREALQLLEQTAQKPGAGAVEWNEYADALLKVDWNDLRQPAKALHLAENAVLSTGRKNPFFLDTLAWAYFRTGNAPRAVETEREALHLLPADAKGGLREELDHGLTTFLGGPDR